MARTTGEIFDAIILDKETAGSLTELQPEPDSAQQLAEDLTSTSKVGIHRLLYYIVAQAIQFLEQIFDLHVIEVQDIADKIITATTRWYQEEALKFQLGDDLLFITALGSLNGKFQYAVLDESKQIIKRAAVTESGTQVVIKVAKLVADVPAPLDVAELAAFTQYTNEFRIAGTDTLIISAPPDELQLDLRVFYDPLQLDAAGESLANPGTFPAIEAIDGFISNLPFNGKYENTALVDAVQLAEGVEDPRLDEARSRFGANPYSIIADSVTPNAGHMVRDIGGSNITYVSI